MTVQVMSHTGCIPPTKLDPLPYVISSPAVPPRHPHDLNPAIRPPPLPFDQVTEILQGLIDLGGGSYFSIAQPTPITPLLGDPAPGIQHTHTINQ